MADDWLHHRCCIAASNKLIPVADHEHDMANMAKVKFLFRKSTLKIMKYLSVTHQRVSAHILRGKEDKNAS